MITAFAAAMVVLAGALRPGGGERTPAALDAAGGDAGAEAAAGAAVSQIS
jgi:hypothetical protein